MIGWMFRGRSFRARLLLLLAICGAAFYYWEAVEATFRTHFNDQPEKEQSKMDQLDHELRDLINKARDGSLQPNRDPAGRAKIEEYRHMLNNAQKQLDNILGTDDHEIPIPSDSVEKPAAVIKPSVPGQAYDFNRGIPTDPDALLKRNKVREMMKFAWDGYVEKGWSFNEVRPISGKGYSAAVFGNSKTGATIVDALDTLWIMGLTDEFKQARDWVEKQFVFNSGTDVSVFETVIRFVGGFLSAGALSGDRMFYDKAKYVADLLEGAFKTDSGIPMALVNPSNGKIKNWNWASGGCSILAEIGTLHLEFSELSHQFNDSKYLDRVMKIRDILKSMSRPGKWLPKLYFWPERRKWNELNFILRDKLNMFQKVK